MADRREKKPHGGEVTDSIANPQTSDNGGKLSWRQFFDNEKYRHHLMLMKTRQYSELLSALRQGYTISDPYKPPVELPSPEETFPPSDHADDDITISHSGLSLDFSVTSTYPTLSTQSTYSTQNSTKDGKHSQRLTIALVMFGLIILIAMSVTIGVVLHVRLDTEKSPVSTLLTNDVNKLDVNSSSHQQSSTESSGQQSSTPSSTRRLTSSLLQNQESETARGASWSLINSLSAQPMSVWSKSRPTNPQMFEASTLTFPSLSTPALPTSFVPVTQYSQSALPKHPLTSLDMFMKSSRSTDLTTLLPKTLLQPTTPPVTKLSLLLLTQWSALPSSDTHASSLLSSTKQPLSHMTPPSQTRSPGSALPVLPLSKTSSTGETHALTSSILSQQNSHTQEIAHPNQLVNSSATDSLLHLFDSFLSKSSQTSAPHMFTPTAMGLSPSSMSNVYRSAVSSSSLANIRTSVTTATPMSSLSETSKRLKSKTETVSNPHNPDLQKQSIVNGSTIATHDGQTHSLGHDSQQAHLNENKTPSSGSFEPGLQHLQLNPFKIPISPGPVILTASDSIQPYFRAPVQSEWTQTTTNAAPRTLYSPSQISGPAKLSHPSSDGSHNYMSKLTLPVTATQKGTTALKSGLASNTTSHVADEKSQFLEDFTFSKFRATASLVDTAAEKPIKEVFVTTERTREATASTITLLFPNVRRVANVDHVHELLPSAVLSQSQNKSDISVASTSAEISKLREGASFPFAFDSTASPLAPSGSSINKDEDNEGRIHDEKSANIKTSTISSSGNSFSTFENPHTLKSSPDRFPSRQDGSVWVAPDTIPSKDPKRNLTFQTEQSRLGKYTYTLVNTSTPQTFTAPAADIDGQTLTAIARDIGQIKKAINNPATNISSSIPEIKERDSDRNNLHVGNFNTQHPNAGIGNKNNTSGSNITLIPQKMATAGIHATALNTPNVTMTTETEDSIKLDRQHLMSDISHTLSSDNNDAAATRRDNEAALNRQEMPNTNTEMVGSYVNSKQNTTMHRAGTFVESDITLPSMLGTDLSNSRATFTNTPGNAKDNSSDIEPPNTSYGILNKTHNMSISYTNNITSYASSQFHSKQNDIKVSPTLDGSAPSAGGDVSKIGRDSSILPSRRTQLPSDDAKSALVLSPQSSSMAGAQNKATSTNTEVVPGTSNHTSKLQSAEASNQRSASTPNQQSMGTLNGQSKRTSESIDTSMGTLNRKSMEIPDSNHQSANTSNQQSKRTSPQESIESAYKQSTKTSQYQQIGASNQASTERPSHPLRESTNQQSSGTSNQQPTEKLNQQFRGTSHGESIETSSQQSNKTSNQHSAETSHQLSKQESGTSHGQSIGASSQQSNKTSNQHSAETLHQLLKQATGTSHGGSIGASSQQSNKTSNQHSAETSHQLSKQATGTSHGQSIGTSSQQSNKTSNQHSAESSHQLSKQATGTSHEQARKMSTQHPIETQNKSSLEGSINVLTVGTSHQESKGTSNQQSHGTSNHRLTVSLNYTSNGISNQESLETLNQQPSTTSKQQATGTAYYQTRRQLNQATFTTPSQQFTKAGNNESMKKSNQDSQRTISQHSTGTPNQHSLGTSNEQSNGTLNQHWKVTSNQNSMGTSDQQSRETAHTLTSNQSKVPSTQLNKSGAVATTNKATLKANVTANSNEDETAASAKKSPSSEVLQTPKATAGRPSNPRSKATLPDSQSGSAVTQLGRNKDARIEQINATTDEPPVYMNTSSDQNISVSTTTATTTVTIPATTTTLDPFASFQGVGNPDGGSLSLSALDSGLKKDELNPGVLLDYTFLLQNLPPPEVPPKAIATKVAVKPPPLPTVAPPPTPKPAENTTAFSWSKYMAPDLDTAAEKFKIIAPDVVAEIGMSPTSNLKVVCTVQKAWGWTYIAISRYEGDSEFSLEFLGGVDKSDEWPFIPIDSRMSDFTLHRDDDQVTFALETKYALCEDKGRYLCEIKVNRTFFSKTFNVDVKKRPEKPDLQFPEDVIEGQNVWLVTTWDAGNPVIGYIVHDIVKGFTGLPYASTLESTNAWYKDCAVMIENKYSVTPELSWNGTEIVAHILPKDNATVYERSIVERVKYDRKIMTVLDKNICTGQTSVRIAHPYRGDKYITCYSNGPAVTTCPKNHVFDEVKKICVRPGVHP